MRLELLPTKLAAALYNAFGRFSVTDLKSLMLSFIYIVWCIRLLLSEKVLLCTESYEET